MLAPVVFGPWAQHAHCQGTATSGAGVCWGLGPIAKGQPQVEQNSWGPVGAPEAMTPRSQLPLVLANGCGFFLSRCGGALVDGFELPALFFVGMLAPVVFGPWAQHAHCQGSATGGADFMGASWVHQKP